MGLHERSALHRPVATIHLGQLICASADSTTRRAAQFGVNLVQVYCIMRYVLKQKLFSIGGAFYIKDDQGRDGFLVGGRVLVFGTSFFFEIWVGIKWVLSLRKGSPWGRLFKFTAASNFFRL